MLAYSVLFSFIIGGVISGVPDFRLSIRWNKYKQELEQGLYICPWSEGDIGYCTIEDGIDGTHNSALAFCASKRDAVECDAHPSCKWEGGEPPEYCNSFTRTKCFSKAVNVWSDWAYFPVRWKGETHYHTITVGMDKVGCGDEMVLDGADTDFRVCIQVASETQEGEVSCSEWSSNGRQGGTGELADTLQGDPVSRVRITIEVRPMVDATPINDFRIGLFDDNMVVYRDWVTAFFVEKDKDRVLTKREFGVYNEYDNIGKQENLHCLINLTRDIIRILIQHGFHFGSKILTRMEMKNLSLTRMKMKNLSLLWLEIGWHQVQLVISIHMHWDYHWLLLVYYWLQFV